jgi:hypothetical protein
MAMHTKQKKSCSKCKRNLSRDAFFKDKTSKDGKSRVCRECDRRAQRKWRAKKKAERESAQA